jgi:hypothetical protein
LFLLLTGFQGPFCDYQPGQALFKRHGTHLVVEETNVLYFGGIDGSRLFFGDCGDRGKTVEEQEQSTISPSWRQINTIKGLEEMGSSFVSCTMVIQGLWRKQNAHLQSLNFAWKQQYQYSDQ